LNDIERLTTERDALLALGSNEVLGIERELRRP